MYSTILERAARYECVSQTERVACAQRYWKERLGISVSHRDSSMCSTVLERAARYECVSQRDSSMRSTVLEGAARYECVS